MRFLHTSDWHLGRLFHHVDLLDEQQMAVDRIVEIAHDSEVDVVLLAGDVHDRAIPPIGAVNLFDYAMDALRTTGARVVAISGNHDSPTRLCAHDRLLTSAGVTVRGDVRRLCEPVVLDSTDGGPPVAIYPIPYLDPATTGWILEQAHQPGEETSDSDSDTGETGAESPQGRSSRFTHNDVTRTALERVRADAATRGSLRSVVVAHTFVRGGSTSDSERELTVGNVDVVDIEAFKGFDYVALGHLHGSQVFAEGRIAYSGTPLPYSFSEENQTKSVRIVEMDETGSVTAESIPLGIGRPLRTVRGTLEALLTGAEWVRAETSRVRAILTDTHPPIRAMARLQERFPYAVELCHEPPTLSEAVAGTPGRAADPERPPLELVKAFWTEQVGADATDEEAKILEAAISAAVQEVEEVAAP